MLRGCGLRVIWEDGHLIAVDKPSGLLSIAAGSARDKTAVSILTDYLSKRGYRQRPAVVHRLDRETSGVMIFAKSGKVKKLLMDNWNALVTQRRYYALAEGRPGQNGEEEGTIDAALGEDASGRVIVKVGGQRAVTHWKVRGAGNGWTLLSLELETGRRNQIRAHLSYARCPVAGDRKYSSRTNPLGRLCLHADSITVIHPVTSETLHFTSPVPKGFFTVMKPQINQHKSNS